MADEEKTVPTRSRKRPANAAGFTLLEVLVAVAILAMSLTSLLSSQMAGLRATNKARMLSTVAFLAEYQLIEIEWQLKEEGGWGTDDRTFEGDFSDQGWPSVSYQCVVDLIEMPDYTQLQAAADAADTDDEGIGGYDVQDAGETAFDTLGMVWPIVKSAIENSIRKSWCTVRWTLDGEIRKSQQDDTLCGEDEFQCMSVATFWTDPAALLNLPAAGGEVTEEDDLRDDGGGGGGGGDGAGRGGGGGGKGGIGAGGPVTPPSQRGGR